MPDARRRDLYAAFADLLSYPRGQVAAAAARAQALAGARGEAGTALARFTAAVGAHDGTWLEELYTSTFDLAPACAPYVGHQLFGDSPIRGPFLAKLAEVFAAGGFQPREELGDHVAEVLRFAAQAPPAPALDELLRDGLVPALEKMIASLEEPRNPYREVLAALLALLALLGRGSADAARAAQEVAT
ncbi:nitrate reductase molybdenum cofactor assembly chaperone [Anaeromyxobacter diazotrophicus]|uniref:Nitrate reductase molybdenum cofactor assembly chaperone n=1 Tax=Anaeromyxobacter diazotrophicus TaxID=2590199 RepID=A0A7I9VLG7_9BACT|nr:molecular chaperone TorD family protein [Anaeromyxobacter diazotrophicus]GEJ56970.1 hypothetical protein AMYX_17110 [Anaeromyxobacter diazotrophicus]